MSDNEGNNESNNKSDDGFNNKSYDKSDDKFDKTSDQNNGSLARASWIFAYNTIYAKKN